MTAVRAAPMHAPRQAARVVAVSVLVVAATLLGAWRVAARSAPAPDAMTLRLGSASYTVTHVEQVAGLTDADLGGMAHGVQGLVADDHALLRVSVTVSAGSFATDYDAGALKAFVAGSTAGVAPSGGSLAPGKLMAHGRIDGSLSYVVPRDGRQVVLRAGQLPRQVPLLQVDRAPAHATGHTRPVPAASGHRAAPSHQP